MERDQRQHDRTERKVALIYYFDDESQARRLEEATLTLDLGGGGLSMTVQQHLDVGRAIHLKVVLGHQSVQCRGRIAYVNARPDGSHRVGVSLELDDAQRLQMEGFLANG